MICCPIICQTDLNYISHKSYFEPERTFLSEVRGSSWGKSLIEVKKNVFFKQDLAKRGAKITKYK